MVDLKVKCLSLNVDSSYLNMLSVCILNHFIHKYSNSRSPKKKALTTYEVLLKRNSRVNLKKYHNLNIFFYRLIITFILKYSADEAQWVLIFVFQKIVLFLKQEKNRHKYLSEKLILSHEWKKHTVIRSCLLH